MVMEGELAFFIFDDAGQVINTHILGVAQAANSASAATAASYKLAPVTFCDVRDAVGISEGHPAVTIRSLRGE